MDDEERERLLREIEDGMAEAERWSRALGRPNSNRLWSDTGYNDVYENNHGCWDWATPVN